MGVSGVSSSGFASYPSAGRARAESKNAVQAEEDAELKELIAYFQMSPEERAIRNWLEAHGYTEEEFEALPPEKKEALRKEMAAEIKEKVEHKAKEKSKALLDVMA